MRDIFKFTIGILLLTTSIYGLFKTIFPTNISSKADVRAEYEDYCDCVSGLNLSNSDDANMFNVCFKKLEALNSDIIETEERGKISRSTKNELLEYVRGLDCHDLSEDYEVPNM